MKSVKAKKGPAFREKQFLKVGFLFCSSVILLDLLVWYLGRREYLAFFDIFTSYVIANLIQFSGLHVIRDSNTIYLSHTTWLVTTECTALFIMLMFSCFVFAYPSSVKQKTIALFAGIPFIFGANIVRLYIMAWIDYLKPDYSELFHNYMWQVVFIAMVVFMWLIWIDTVVSRESKTSVSP